MIPAALKHPLPRLRDLKPAHYIAAVCLLAFLSISGVFGNAGFLQAYRLRAAREILAQRVLSLKSEKTRLSGLASVLERERSVQEIVVRDTLGFVRDHELVFEFAD